MKPSRTHHLGVAAHFQTSSLCRDLSSSVIFSRFFFLFSQVSRRLTVAPARRLAAASLPRCRCRRSSLHLDTVASVLEQPPDLSLQVITL